MKQLLIIVCMTSLYFCEAKAQSKVIANVTNLRNDDGVCRACLFSNVANFTDQFQPSNCVRVIVKNKAATVVFTDVKPGAYAVLVFHDVNNNNKMDKNFLGVPKEGYGASKNKLPFASAPQFEDNKFVVPNNNVVSLNIHLRNLL